MTSTTTMPSSVTVTPIGIEMTPTDIDRRGSKRVVPIKLLCLGLGRTGTSSLRTALVQLGFFDVYHMVSMIQQNPRDGLLWTEAFDAKFKGEGKPWRREDWDQLFGHCMAISDWPAAAFADELMAAYPEAKVLLTVRDTPQAWHKSVRETIFSGFFIFGPPASWLQRFVQWQLGPGPYILPAMHRLYTHTALKEDFPTRGQEAYLAHNAHVRAIAPAGGRFLEFNVKDGWAPLCAFLDVPVPDVPFPRVNDTGSWRAYVSNQQRRGVINLLTGLGSTLALAFGLWGVAYSWYGGRQLAWMENWSGRECALWAAVTWGTLRVARRLLTGA